MGYFVKKDKHGNEGFVLPSGPTSERPATPIKATLRYNTDLNSLEYFNGTQFVDLAKAGFAEVGIDRYVGDNITTTFTPMSFISPTAKHLLVFVNGIYQTPITNYTVFGFDITFTSVIPTGEPITIIHGMSNTLVTSDVFDVPNL